MFLMQNSHQSFKSVLESDIIHSLTCAERNTESTFATDSTSAPFTNTEEMRASPHRL